MSLLMKLTLAFGVLVGSMLGTFLIGRFIGGRLKYASVPEPVGRSPEEEPDWKTLYLEEYRKRAEQFRMIEGVQRERDGWKDIFWQSSREHGVAQEYMIRVNQHFAKICGKHPDAKMPAMRKAFLEKYGEEARPKIAERIQGGRGGTGEGVSGVTAAPAFEGELLGVGASGTISTGDGGETRAAPVAKPESNA